MFESVGWGEILVLVVAGLFILGPERLPEAAAWLGRTIRQVREYATGARDQLRNELGPEFDQLRKPLDELRKPLEELRGLRDLNPRTMVTRHLFDDPPEAKPNGYTPDLTKPAPQQQPPAVQLGKNERPPIDPDAT
jgi:sec-independent protein translocase protein TatB